MAGTRFLIPGLILYVWQRKSGVAAPRPAQWRSAAIIGALLLLIGNGGVSWAEKTIPSGVTALLVSTSPFWFVVLDWLWFGGPKPSGRTLAGLVLGLIGVAVLVGPDQLTGGGVLQPLGLGVLLVATVAWSSGSLYSRRAQLPESPYMATAAEMLAGGTCLLTVSLVAGEPFRLDWGTISLSSVLAVAYLSVVGSLIAFTAYVWLLRVSTPARVSTYAFVNPAIAVFLGWALGGEEISTRLAVAAVIIVISVVLIVARKPVAPETDVQEQSRG
jgi:drug/metabolite transporter (DMT)-like permease